MKKINIQGVERLILLTSHFASALAVYENNNLAWITKISRKAKELEQTIEDFRNMKKIII